MHDAKVIVWAQRLGALYTLHDPKEIDGAIRYEPR